MLTIVCFDLDAEPVTPSKVTDEYYPVLLFMQLIRDVFAIILVQVVGCHRNSQSHHHYLDFPIESVIFVGPS